MTIEQQIAGLSQQLGEVTGLFRGIYQQHESARTTMINDVNAFISSFAYRTATTLEVGAGKPYATINAALDVIRDKVLITPVLIKVADGIYDFTDVSLHNHPFAHKIKIEGNIANPSNCVIRWKADAHGDSRGFIIGNCRGLNISGFKLIGSCTDANITHRSVLLNNSLLISDAGSLIISDGYRGIESYNSRYISDAVSIDSVKYSAIFGVGSQFDLPNTVITGAGASTFKLPSRLGGETVGLCGVWLLDSSRGNLTGIKSSNIYHGVISERSSFAEISGSKLDGCYYGALAAYGGAMVGYAYNSIHPTANNCAHGFVSSIGGALFLDGGTATGSSVVGFRATGGGNLFVNNGSAKTCAIGFQSTGGSVLNAVGVDAASTGNTVKYDVDANSKLIWS